MALVVYGMAGCERCRKLMKLFDENDVEYEFVDFRKTPPTEEDIKRWEEFNGGLPVNSRGATYKEIKKKFNKMDYKDQVKTLISTVAAIDRPIVELDGEVKAVGGRQETVYLSLFD